MRRRGRMRVWVMIRWSGCGGSVWGCLRRPSGSAMVSRPFVRDKKVFVSYADHHHDDRLSFWCHAPAGAQQALVEADPQRFFRPPYVGGRGWIGVYLDVERDEAFWQDVAELVEDAYRMVAPRRLLDRLDAERSGP